MNTALLLAALLLAQAGPAQSQPAPTEPAPTEPAPTEPAPTEPTQSEAPWFYTQVLVPAGIGVLASLVTLGLGIWQIKHTEWYRRASRWEPYAEQIWQTRQKAYEELYRHHWSLSHDAHNLITLALHMPESLTYKELDNFYNEMKKTLLENQGVASIASPKVMESLGKLVATYQQVWLSCTDKLGGLETLRNKLSTALDQFINALREDIRVDPIDAHFSEAMELLKKKPR